MTFLQLSYFVSLAETLHYTKTAEMLHISQPSLSYAISELERDLGVKLFSKEKQSVKLTKYGKQYYPYVKRALESLKDGHNILKAMSNPQKTVVRFGYFHSISASLIPALISGFQQKPESENVQFQLTEDSVPNLLSLLKNGELDFCFSCHQEDWAHSIAIAQQPLYLAVPKNHALASKKTVSFADFAQEPQIMLTPGSDLRTQIDRLFSDNDAIPNIVFETRECNAALQYVALNFGVSVLPQVPVMDRDILTIVPIIQNDNKELSRVIYLTYQRAHDILPAAHCVIEYILSRFGIIEQPLRVTLPYHFGEWIGNGKCWVPFLQSVVIFGHCRLVKSQPASELLLKRSAVKLCPNENMVDDEISPAGKGVRMYEIEFKHFSGKEVQE